MNDTIIFRGEMQLLRWSETSNSGATVTFQLADPADLERFKNLTMAKKGQAGQRIAAMMAEIGDDEQPVQQPPKEEKPKGGELAKVAGILCNTEKFRKWLHSEHNYSCFENDGPEAFIYRTCGIESRIDLDHNKAAAEIFHNEIRAPYIAWRDKGSHQ